jgi:radical SAM protein with 4Fe4S-binding SPASM domain
MAKPEQIEALLARPDVQRACRWITRRRRDGGCLLSDFFAAYGADHVPLGRRLAFLAPMLLTEYVRRRAGASKEVLRRRVMGHGPTCRALVNTVRSIGAYGLRRPQVWTAPLLAVWNFTQACNLKCRHCYQDAQRPLADELGLSEQLAVLDHLREQDVPWVAFAGGEPLMGRNFWPVVRHAGRLGFHISVATNGTLLTRDVAERLADAGVRYVEVSVDSASAAMHDEFRGGRGYWERAVRGLDAAVATGRLRVSLAATITRLNLHELPQIIDFAVAHGAHTFYAFNFIPTGRAADAAEIDLTPQMREEMLELLQAELHAQRIAIMTSCPQMGRATMQHPDRGVLNTGHYGFGNARLVKHLVPYVGGCGAGRCYIAIQPNGLVTPCVFMPHLVIGDLRRQRLPDFWPHHPVLKTLHDRAARTGHCAVCDYQLQCGGCRARPLGYFGDLTRSDPGCIYNLPEWREVAQRA